MFCTSINGPSENDQKRMSSLCLLTRTVSDFFPRASIYRQVKTEILANLFFERYWNILAF